MELEGLSGVQRFGAKCMPRPKRLNRGVAVAICTIGLFLELNVSAKSAAGPSRLDVKEDGTAHVQGPVLQNSHRCEVDGVCFLRLSVDGQDVRVIYGAEQHEACPGGFSNKTASDAAWSVKKGALIEASGKHHFTKDARIPSGLHVIAVCDSTGY